MPDKYWIRVKIEIFSIGFGNLMKGPSFLQKSTIFVIWSWNPNPLGNAKNHHDKNAYSPTPFSKVYANVHLLNCICSSYLQSSPPSPLSLGGHFYTGWFYYHSHWDSIVLLEDMCLTASNPSNIQSGISPKWGYDKKWDYPMSSPQMVPNYMHLLEEKRSIINNQ